MEVPCWAGAAIVAGSTEMDGGSSGWSMDGELEGDS